MKLASILLAVLFSFPVQGQKDQTIYGIILSSQDFRPIPGVTVLLEGSIFGAITDDNGIFKLKVPGGSILVMSHLSFDTKKMTVPQAADSIKHMVIMLDPAQPSELDTVITSPTDENTFMRDFKNLQMPDTLKKLADYNLEKKKREALLQRVPVDGKESMAGRTSAVHNSHRQAFQTPHLKVLDLFIWYKMLFPPKKKRIKTITF